MSKVINSLLVGIGLNYDPKGEKEAIGAIDRVKSSALQLGTVVAGAFGAKALTADFADSRDTLGRFAETVGVVADDVQAMGNALAREGGSLEAYMSQLENIEQLRAGLLVGDAEFISIAGRAQIDTTDLIAAGDATEAYLTLADQFQRMTQQQRLNAANALGLDESSIRLLSRGREGVEQLVEQQRNIRPVTESMTQSSRVFNEQMHDLGQNIGGVADQISDKLLPEVNEITKGINAWFTENNELIDQNLDKALEPIADNFSEIAVAGGLFAASGTLSTFAGLAKYVPIVGGGLAGIAGSLGTITALGAAGATGYAIGSIIEPFIDEDIGRTTARVFAAFGNEEAQQALDAEREMFEAQGLEQPGIPIWDWNREQASEATGIDLPEWLFKPLDEIAPIEQPVELTPSWSEEDIPMSTLPRNEGIDEDVPTSNVIPLEFERNDLTPFDPMNVDVQAERNDLTPFDPMGVDVQAERNDLTPFDPMSVDVSPRAIEPTDVTIPVDVSRERVEPERLQQPVIMQQAIPQQTQRDERPLVVQANLSINGQALDDHIIRVNDRQNQIALDDIQSTVRA